MLNRWQGHTLIGGDFNLIRFFTDKSNSRINHRWVDSFNSWVDKWGLIELNPANRLFTWANNQENNLIFARIDRISATTEWDNAFPLTRVSALERSCSDHTPLVFDTGNNCSLGKKRFRFKKWWLENKDFKQIVIKACNSQDRTGSAMDIWQEKIRVLRRNVRGWAANMVAELNRNKKNLADEYNVLELEAENRTLSEEEI